MSGVLSSLKYRTVLGLRSASNNRSWAAGTEPILLLQTKTLLGLTQEVAASLSLPVSLLLNAISYSATPTQIDQTSLSHSFSSTLAVDGPTLSLSSPLLFSSLLSRLLSLV